MRARRERRERGERQARRRQLTGVVVLGLLGACGRPAPGPTPEVKGAVALDGAARTVVACAVTSDPSDGGSTVLQLHLDDGRAVLYFEGPRVVTVRAAGQDGPGERYKCTSGAARDIFFGSSPDAPGYFHGHLELGCGREQHRVELSVDLACGTLPPSAAAEAERRRATPPPASPPPATGDGAAR